MRINQKFLDAPPTPRPGVNHLSASLPRFLLAGELPDARLNDILNGRSRARSSALSVTRPEKTESKTREYLNLALDDINEVEADRIQASFSERAAEMNQHIIGFHFAPGTLRRSGIARFDLERGAYLNFPVETIVQEAIKRLQYTDRELSKKTLRYYSNGMAPAEYRAWIILHLRYMEDLRLTKINWPSIGTNYAKYSQVQVEIDLDSADLPFPPYQSSRITANIND